MFGARHGFPHSLTYNRVIFILFITVLVVERVYLPRASTKTMAPILERLELEQPLLLSSVELTQMLEEEGISTPASVFAARLRERGWLLATSQRGVWEFVPAAVAGSYSSMDPLIQLKALLAVHENFETSLTFTAAAWAMGLADRAPVQVDIAVPKQPVKLSLPEGLMAHTFIPKLETIECKGVPCLAPESVFVHMATRPSGVSSWQSASEWLPDLAHELDESCLLDELAERNSSIKARAGYLLQGMRPDLSAAIMDLGAPKSKVRFGARNKSLRNDERWLIADTLLPFDPRTLEDVR